MTTRRTWILFAGLPVASLLAYFLLLGTLPTRWVRFLLSETGPVELGTALLFFAASFVAVGHLRRHRDVPAGYRALFVLFAIAGLFVALEEISYGQHLVEFESPQWFMENNKQQETNLHNLIGSKPSRRVRTLGNISFPVFCLVLPLIFLRNREAWTPGHWPYYLLPRTELISLTIVSLLVTVPKKFPENMLAHDWQTRLGEVKEFYWALIAFLYICLMSKRLTANASSEEQIETVPFPAQDSQPTQDSQHVQKRAA